MIASLSSHQVESPSHSRDPIPTVGELKLAFIWVNCVFHDPYQPGGIPNRMRRDTKLRTEEGQRLLLKFAVLRVDTIPASFARGMARGRSLKPIAMTRERTTTGSICVPLRWMGLIR